MTPGTTLPDLVAEPELAAWIASRCADSAALPEFEQTALTGILHEALQLPGSWLSFRERALALWREYDHVIVRGVPVGGDGVSLLCVALVLCQRFKGYRGNQIVKHFRMSPWTTELSHTLQEGHFHTDINTAADPPAVTAIQCRVPDPGAPKYGEVRVSRLSDLLHALRCTGEVRTLAFLQETDVTMVNDSSPDAWAGRIVSGDTIRFHPETLRAAQRRHGGLPDDLEDHLRTIKTAALSVSVPIQLGAGDVLLVSNRRALHYRGACSVIFHSFPRGFSSREVYVLHMLDEPI